MPAAQVEFDDGYKSLGRIVDGGNMQEHLGVAHEAATGSARLPSKQSSKTYFVILSSMLRGSRINVGKTTRLRSAPGRNCEMMCVRTAV